MSTTPTIQVQVLNPYSTDEARWQAVVNRDSAADGAFFYSVETTGVYCRPGCPAKRPRRENVRFYETREEAEKGGFRPCMRCRPSDRSLAERHAAAVSQACRSIEGSDEAPHLNEMATAVGMSVSQFHRVFKAQTGLTPKAYAAAHRARRVRSELEHSPTVTQALYDAGYNSNGRFYESAKEVLGMTPKAFRAGGDGARIRFAVGECTLGSILVAASDKGVCAILLGDEPDALVRDLQDRFPKAILVGGDAAFERVVAETVGCIENPAAGFNLPLDIRGTAFQHRVWQALREIPSGATASYTQIAKAIGRAGAVPAVARACAANPIAVAIPCHRVVRTDGALAGYRWGIERKRELLQRERQLQHKGTKTQRTPKKSPSRR